MTSTPVMSSVNSQSMNLLNSVQNTSRTTGTDFKDFMNQSTKNAGQNEKNDIKTDFSQKAGDKQVHDEKPVKETGETTEKVTSAKEPETKGVEVGNKEVKSVTDAIEDVKQVIEEELNVSEEEIANALNALGLTLFALLDENALPTIVAKLTDSEDVLSLTTDEGLYESLTNIATQVGEIKDTMLRQIDIPKEDFEKALLEVEKIPATEEAADGVTDFSKDFDLSDKNTVINKDFVNTEEIDETETLVKEKTFEEKITVTKDDSTKTYVSKESSPEEISLDISKAEIVDAGKDRKDFGNSDYSQNPGNNLNFAQNLLSKTAEVLSENSESVSYTSFDAENIMNQITESIEVNISSEVNEISLRLHPESLGTVNVKVSANHEGVLTAQFYAQNEGVKEVIESQAVILKEALESKGVTVEAVEVAVQSHQFERNLNQQNGRNEESSQPKKKGLRRIDLTDSTEEVTNDGDDLVKEMMAQNGNLVDYSA